MLRTILIAISVLISIPVLLFLTAWLYPRPVDTTPPWVFESDGSELNYCDLPELDGSGQMANDIPRAYHARLWLYTIPSTYFARLY